MLSAYPITSRTNPKIKEAVHLRERRTREKEQLFIIEGYRELLRAFEGNQELTHLFFCESFFLGTNEEALLSSFSKKGVILYTCSPSVFEKISYRDRPDGLLAIAKQLHQTLLDLEDLLNKKKTQAFLLIAEGIEKPGNLGTLLRSSDATKVDAVIASSCQTDIFNPNVVRASVGTLFTVPVIEASSDETIAFLKKHQIKLISSTPSATNMYTDVDLTGPVALAVGTEQLGLTERFLNECNISVKIPMLGHADSLNVAMAGTLLLYEVIRQRTNLCC